MLPEDDEFHRPVNWDLRGKILEEMTEIKKQKRKASDDMCGWCKGDLAELGRWHGFDFCSRECYEDYWRTVLERKIQEAKNDGDSTGE